MVEKAKPVVKAKPKIALIAKGLKFLKTNPNLDNGYHYGIFTKTGDRIESYNHACHAGLSDFHGGEVLYTFTPPPRSWKNCDRLPLDNQDYRDYLQWLLEGSPWQMAGVESKTNLELAATKGFLIFNTKLPANLIANFCIATRVPNEHFAVVKRWHEFVAKGVHPNVAFVFASGLYDSNHWRTMDPGHYPFDAATVTKRGVENFVHGKIGQGLQPFVKSGYYLPCNDVWEPKGGHNMSYRTYLMRAYPATEDHKEGRMFNVRPAHGGWATGQAKDLYRPKAHWIEIALAESKRMIHVKAA